MIFWIGFFAFVFLALYVDMTVLNKKVHTIRLKEALKQSAFWIGLAVIFNIAVYFFMGTEKAVEFLTAYLIEESLSMDNLFVFLMIFQYFQVPDQYQHKVLYWGILSAIVMRLIFIFAGVTLVAKFHWVIYVFGAFLVFTAIKMLLKKDEEIHPENNPMLKLFKRFVPVTHEYHQSHFFTKEAGRLIATPLMVVLFMIEISDIAFAVDSIPAVLCVSNDLFIVYTSNIFAILGLRSLYFALAGLMPLFHYLKYGLAFILGFIGTKMLIVNFCKIPTGIALGVVGSILILSVIASIVFPPKKKEN
ncbi:MAG TPA: TerC family protein, partial [bacterium]|nr:TerC family protein [bacterium]